LIIFDRTHSVAEALKLLAQFNILSAPVMNKETNMILGSLDVLDLCTFVFSTPRESSEWLSKVKEKFRSPLDKVVDFSKINPFLPVYDETSLDEIINFYFVQGIHRVPLFSGREISSILAQFDIVDFIFDQMKRNEDVQLKLLANKTVRQLDLIPGQVISIRDNCSVFLAFESIIANNTGGIAIVNKEGKLVGNLSATDFEGVTEENFRKVEKMLKEVIKTKSVIHIKSENTLFETLSLFCKTRVHQIYIVDNNFQPIGVVTMTDIMRILKRELK